MDMDVDMVVVVHGTCEVVMDGGCCSFFWKVLTLTTLHHV